jgi:hypothetical protein
MSEKVKDGGYCPRCDTVWASPGKCRCSSLLAKHEPAIDAMVRETWNAAIEAAAKDCDKMGEEARISENIRNLKK